MNGNINITGSVSNGINVSSISANTGSGEALHVSNTITGNVFVETSIDGDVVVAGGSVDGSISVSGNSGSISVGTNSGPISIGGNVMNDESSGALIVGGYVQGDGSGGAVV